MRKFEFHLSAAKLAIGLLILSGIVALSLVRLLQ